ncbi:hypothetical protein [Nonomuraea jabiensis]|uniref:Pyruvate carboxyltransferase domain-containing protein n=1 Tax=Nonomuraea jabiensis TaxID=882448 RepID=A0A7W9FXQ9_9ACTN|nr:hypothetical protein [Nonomuraea jabiensis]MBB5773525.1 hypothetical protein [Nonomuraea jabiensis]
MSGPPTGERAITARFKPARQEPPRHLPGRAFWVTAESEPGRLRQLRTLRDGSHAMAHRFTADQVRAVVRALDAAGVRVIEVTHGDGLGGSSFNYGFSAVDDVELVRVAGEAARDARIAVLLLPGLGTVADLRRAHDAGATVARGRGLPVRVRGHDTAARFPVQGGTGRGPRCRPRRRPRPTRWWASATPTTPAATGRRPRRPGAARALYEPHHRRMETGRVRARLGS